MKTIAKFLFAFVLILSVSGNAAEKGNTSIVENYIIETKTISESTIEQRMPDVPEPISLLIIGAGLISLGIFARKKNSHTSN
jgi:PEP-CTERM motif